MPITVTRDELRAMNPCDVDSRMKLFGRRKRLSAAQAMEAGASVRDILWVAYRLGRKDLCVKFALACAQRCTSEGCRGGDYGARRTPAQDPPPKPTKLIASCDCL